MREIEGLKKQRNDAIKEKSEIQSLSDLYNLKTKMHVRLEVIRSRISNTILCYLTSNAGEFSDIKKCQQ